MASPNRTSRQRSSGKASAAIRGEGSYPNGGADHHQQQHQSVFPRARSGLFSMRDGISVVTSAATAAMAAIGIFETSGSKVASMCGDPGVQHQQQKTLRRSGRIQETGIFERPLSPMDLSDTDSFMMDVDEDFPSIQVSARREISLTSVSSSGESFSSFLVTKSSSTSIEAVYTPHRPHPLMIPEILHIVFSFLETPLNTGTDPAQPMDFVKVDSIKYALSRPKLYSCIMVNKLWNACAMKQLWKNVRIGSDKALDKLNRTLLAQMARSGKKRDYSACFGAEQLLCNHHKSVSFKTSIVNEWQYGLLIKSFIIIPPHGTPNGEPFNKWDIDQLVTTIALSCPKLEDINLSNCAQVTDTSLIILARHCRELKRINLNRCDLVSDLTVIELAKNCPKIEILNLSRPLLAQRLKLSDKALMSIVRDRSHLTELRLRNCDFLSDGTVIEMARTCGKNLKALDLSWCNRITDASAVSGISAHCPNLISIALNGCKQLTDATLLALLSHCPSIASLSLAHLPFITDDILTRLADRLKNLVILSLNGCSNISDASIIALAKACPRLQSLSLFSLAMTDSAVIEVTASCQHLLSLSISGCTEVTDRGAMTIAKLRHLQSLYLNGAKITDVSLETITSSCRGIRALSLNECTDLTDRSIIALSKNLIRLQSLSMNQCGATAVGIKELLIKCYDLRELSIKECSSIQLKGHNAKRIIFGNGGMAKYSGTGEEVMKMLIKRRIALIMD